MLRFWNHDVLGNIEGVLTAIQIELASRHPPAGLPLTPTLSPQELGEGGEEPWIPAHPQGRGEGEDGP